METLGDKNLPKSCYQFYCKYCDYGTCKKSSYKDHILTSKHKKRLEGDKNGDISDGKSAIFLPFEKNIVCENCNKQYMSRNGLWKHKKKCFFEPKKMVGDGEIFLCNTASNSLMTFALAPQLASMA